jgi:stearoyl-CoA desaturase (delta-9 desaturase)
MELWNTLCRRLRHLGRAGLLDAGGWTLLAVVLLATHITILSVTLFLHRAFRRTGRWICTRPCRTFRFWLWLTTGMVTKEWVAIHRKHHAKCETAEDPHSPSARA